MTATNMPGRSREAVIVASGDYSAVDPTAAIPVSCKNATTLRVGVNVTLLSGAGCTVTVTILGVDESGATYTLLSKAITATGLVNMVIDPRIPAAAGVAAQIPLPQAVTVTAVGSGTRTTLTYQISAEVS